MRLIDADELKDLMNLTLDGLLDHPLFDEKSSMLRATFSTVIKMIDNAPTICELGVDLKEKGGKRMKYDCSKALDYSHERLRMCKSFYNKEIDSGSCYKCPLQGHFCYDVISLTPAHIDIVQKWSDEHPEKTRADVFFGMFPNAAKKGGDKQIPVICYQHLLNNDTEFCQESYKCRICWNKPYNNEFEKARENKR